MDNLQNTADKLERQRLKLLTINLIAFIIWDGLRICHTYIQMDNRRVVPFLIILSLIGVAIWIWSIYQIFKAGKALKGNKLMTQILGDELFQSNRNRAFQTSLFTIVAAQIAFLLISHFLIKISGGLIAELNILIVVISFMGSFIFYHGSDDD